MGMIVQQYTKRIFIWIFIILSFLMRDAVLADEPVRIWEETLVIPTYLVDDADPNPMFYYGRAYQGAKGPIYPYPLLDKLTNIRQEKSYTAVYLENKYIQICVLPEIGGRIFSALDKTNGYNFFYRQHVIKPALIGMLGAWISGGVEWNVPHHHRASTFMTVDHTLKENSDGSKTLWIGEMELRHRMRWMIGLTLYPDKSYIEADIKIYNRTAIAHSILCFANVAVHTNPEYQVIFPPGTEFATYHGKNQFSRWPVADGTFSGVDYTGIDVSWWKNHPSPVSFFAWNYKEDFLAGYDHGKEAGVVHIGDHHLVPGKKFFAWGNGSQNEMWDKILTETDGSYLELMAGAYSDNQPDYSWCQPYEVKTFKQYWYPIRQLNHLKNANTKAALDLEFTDNNTANIGLNTTSAYKNAKVIAREKETIIFEQIISISPERPFWKEIPLSDSIGKEDLNLTLLTDDNRELISYWPVKKENNPLPQPVEPPPSPEEIKTIEELYLTGLRLDQFYNPSLEPDPYYEEALKRDPGDYRSNTALGILYLKRGMFTRAEKYFDRAVKRALKKYSSPKDGEALYYLGVALRAQGKNAAAYDVFYKATWSQAWYAAGFFALAEYECQKGNLSKALEFVDRSISMNGLNNKAQCLKASVLRKLGRLDEAVRIASDVVKRDPLDFWGGNEIFLAKSKFVSEKGVLPELSGLEKNMREEVQSYLELAIDYGHCGLFDEAIDVLSRPAGLEKERSLKYPMIYYYLGYYWEQKGKPDKALEYYRLASSMPPDYCFPFRWESAAVLERAIRMNPADARAPYYLGNLLYDHQPQKAITEWGKSRGLDSTFATVHRNLALAYARKDNNIEKAIVSLEKAIACNKKDPRLYFELDQLYELQGTSPQKRLALLENNHQTILKYDDALAHEIILHVQLGHYDRAIDLLKGHIFHIWEGGGRIHGVYVDAYLMRGKKKFKAEKYREALDDFIQALEYPDNLQVGRPSQGGRDSQIYYYIGKTHKALGTREKAQVYYEKSVMDVHGWSEMRYYQGLSYGKLNQEEKALEIFDGLITAAEDKLKNRSDMDFFAKFGEKQSDQLRKANAYYLLGLGYMGKEQRLEAKEAFEEVLRLNINHIGAKDHLSEIYRGQE